MKEYFQILKKLRTNLINLLCFELLYRAALFAAVLQGARIWFNYALKRMGYSYLTAENYPVFIRNGWTLAGLAVFLVVILAALFLEICVISKSWFYGFAGQSRGIRETFFSGFHLFLSLLRKNFPGCLVISAMTGVFACTHFMIREVMDIKILNYALLRIYKWGNDKYILIGALVLFLILSVASLFTVPVMICEGKGCLAAFRRSLSIFRAHVWECLRTVILCNAAITVGILAIYYVLMFGASLFVSTFWDSHVAMGVLFSLSDGIGVVTGFLSGVIGITLNLQNIVCLYVKLEQSAGDPLCIGRAEECAASGKPFFEKQQRKGVFAFLLVILLEVFYVYSVISNGTQIFRDLYAGTLVTAHRGGAKTAPENTLASLEAAINNLSDYAEIDVQETKDGELVLLNDNNLKRTTGVNWKIWETTLEEVKTLDAGSSFSADFAGEQVPTLREALELCRGCLELNIEVKNNHHNADVAVKTAEMITELGMEDQCAISSMSYDFLKDVKEVNPQIRTGYIMSVAYGRVELLEYADFLSVHYDCVNERFMERAHEAGKEVHVWTVNSRKLMRRMKALGVDNIITDRPGVVREILLEDKTRAGFLELMRFAME